MFIVPCIFYSRRPAILLRSFFSISWVFDFWFPLVISALSTCAFLVTFPSVFVCMLSIAFHPWFYPVPLVIALSPSAVCHFPSFWITPDPRGLSLVSEHRSFFLCLFIVKTAIARNTTETFFVWPASLASPFFDLFAFSVFDLCLFYRSRVSPGPRCIFPRVSLVFILDCLTTLNALQICIAIIWTTWLRNPALINRLQFTSASASGSLSDSCNTYFKK